MNFINPYNFIPAGASRPREEQSEDASLSGVITYSVLTKTPLFIPNTSNDDYYGKKPEKQEDKPGENQNESENPGNMPEEKEHMSKEDKHKSYDFYSYIDLSGKGNETACYVPIIPGSEIRGMFRSNFEILTNSCMLGIDDGKKLSKRTMTSFEPGLIKREEVNGGTTDGKKFKFTLYKATDNLWRTKGENNQEYEGNWKDHAWKKAYYSRRCYIQKDFPEGTEVFFTTDSSRDRGKPLVNWVRQKLPKDEKKYEIGYIIKGEPGPDDFIEQKNVIHPQKHCCHIFSSKHGSKENIVKCLDPTDLQYLKDILDIFNENMKGHYSEYGTNLKEFLSGNGSDCFPVYYSKLNNSILYLSPACKTRELYNTTVEKLAGRLLDPCTDLQNLCEACSLFGTVINGKGRASRLRFTDLQLRLDRMGGKNLGDCYKEVTTLQPLSSPKLSNTEFYLKRPDENAIFWTYEYYVVRDPSTKKHRVCTYCREPELAGRKFYWHNLQANIGEDYSTEEVTAQNITVHPLKEGCIFSGKVYFEHITGKELDKLIYLINAGDAATLQDKKHGYKLGAAKPLGFGSIACQVENVSIRTFKKSEDGIQRKISEFSPEEIKDAMAEGNLFGQNTLIDNFHKMTDFDALKKVQDEGYHYSYPRTVDGGDIFQWFSENHKGLVLRRGIECENGSPNARADLWIKKYMEAMNPLLKSTVMELQGNDMQERRVEGNNVPARNEFVEGDIFEGNVTGYNERKTLAIIENNRQMLKLHITCVKTYLNRTGSINMEAELPIGKHVKVNIGKSERGSNGRMYPKISILEIR